MLFKKLWMPVSNETKAVDAVQLWEVRWHSRCGEYSGDTKPELETFISAELAKAFYDALVAAHALLRNKVNIRISMNKAK